MLNNKGLNAFVPVFLRGRLLSGILLAYSAGILLCKCISSGIIFLILLFLSALALFCGLRYKDPRPFLLLFGVSLGFFLCSQQISTLALWEKPNTDTQVLEGRMLGGAQTSAGEQYRLTLSLSSVNGETGSWGRVYVYGEGEPPSPGSSLRVKARQNTINSAANANAFDYSQYLRNQGIAASFYLEEDGLELLKPGALWSPAALSAWLQDSLEASFSTLEQEQATLLKGVFLGDKESLDYSQESVLGLSGIAHAFAVSGMHVGYVVLLAAVISGKSYAKRWRRLLLVILFLLFYLALTGIRPSILRAVTMSLITLFGAALDEPVDLISSLSLAALLSLIWNPLWLLDAGFQLSYGAVLGIHLYQKHWMQSLSPLPLSLRESLASGLAATTLTLPLISYYFYHISWLGCLLSPLAVLAAGFSVCLSMLAAFSALFSTWLGGFLLQTAAWPMLLLYRLAEGFASLPFCASVSGAVPLYLVLIFFLLLVFLPRLLSLPRKRSGKSISSRRIVSAASVLLLLFSLLPLSWSSPQDTTEIVFLDVGQGDATLVRTAEGHTILIDGGGSHESGAVGQYTLLPYLKSRAITHIDLLVSSHPDQDHIDGLLSVLETLDVDAVCYSSLVENNQQQQRLLALSRQQEARLLPIRGQSIRLGESTELLFYPPQSQAAADSNEASLVCRLRCQGVDILLTGDAPASTLLSLAQRYDLQADILHLPHHGSISGYAPEFYAATGSKIAIVSVGAQNSYGHPADLVVEYWQKHGTLYRTDQQGALSLYINDDSFQIESYR